MLLNHLHRPSHHSPRSMSEDSMSDTPRPELGSSHRKDIPLALEPPAPSRSHQPDSIPAILSQMYQDIGRYTVSTSQPSSLMCEQEFLHISKSILRMNSLDDDTCEAIQLSSSSSLMTFTVRRSHSHFDHVLGDDHDIPEPSMRDILELE